MCDSDDHRISFGKTNTTTTLTELFIMLAMERLRGHAYRDTIVAELRRYGIEIKEDTIGTVVKRATELFDVSDTGQISFKRLGAGLQSKFLVRAIRALDTWNSMSTPRRAFRFPAKEFVRCTWTPSGFTAEWLQGPDAEEEKVARTGPLRG